MSTLINGLTWSLIEKVSVIVVQIVLEIILARLLLPSDYGILGMIMVVVAFANVFVDGGFSSALIHHKDRNSADYSTVFYTSIIIGIFSYVIIYLLAPYVTAYYNQNVTTLIRVISITILFNSFGVIYRAKLSIRMDFKKQTLFSMAAMLISGATGVFLAYSGFGVWALIWQLLIFSFLYNLFLFYTDRKVPSWIISRESSKRIFGFGSKIFLSSVIHSIYFNSYPILLGKFHTPQIVGLYTKANQLTTYPAGIFASTIQRVYFPYLVNFQSDHHKIYELNRRFIILFCLFSFPVVTAVVFFANPIIVFVLSATWIEMVVPFQILLIASVFFPIIVLNMNIFQIIGKANLYLYTEIVTKIIGITILVISYKHGFIFVCLGILLQILIQFAITSVITGKLLGVSTFKQIRDVLFLFMINVVIFGISFYITSFNNNTNVFIIAIIILSSFYFLIFWYKYRADFLYIRNLLVSKINKK